MSDTYAETQATPKGTAPTRYLSLECYLAMVREFNQLMRYLQRIDKAPPDRQAQQGELRE